MKVTLHCYFWWVTHPTHTCTSKYKVLTERRLIPPIYPSIYISRLKLPAVPTHSSFCRNSTRCEFETCFSDELCCFHLNIKAKRKKIDSLFRAVDIFTGCIHSAKRYFKTAVSEKPNACYFCCLPRVHAVKYVLSLSIHSLSSVSFCLHSVLRLRMCALDFMHKLFLMSFVPLRICRTCVRVSLVYESWRLLKTLRSKHTLVRFYNTSHIHMLKNTQKHFQSHIDRRQRSKSIFFLAFTFG